MQVLLIGLRVCWSHTQRAASKLVFPTHKRSGRRMRLRPSCVLLLRCSWQPDQKGGACPSQNRTSNAERSGSWQDERSASSCLTSIVSHKARKVIAGFAALLSLCQECAAFVLRALLGAHTHGRADGCAGHQARLGVYLALVVRLSQAAKLTRLFAARQMRARCALRSRCKPSVRASGRRMIILAQVAQR